MLKISFKERNGCPAKTVKVFNNRTTKVTLVGNVKLPEWWWNIPLEINKWVLTHSVDVYVNICLDGAILRMEAEGLSTCSDEDVFSPVYGERIAEARAKIKLYRFMVTLTNKLIAYYRILLFGKTPVGTISNIDICNNDSLYAANIKYKLLLSTEKEHLQNLLDMS